MSENTIAPMVTVVIPVYNGARFLRDAVESVFAQEFQDYELIIVDDGSTDDTLSVAEQFKERAVIIQQEHKGTASAGRNVAHSAGRGRYIAYLDHDDIWARDKLTSVMRVLQADEGVVAAFSDFSRFDWGTGREYPHTHSQLNSDIYSVLDRAKDAGELSFVMPSDMIFHLLVTAYSIYPSTAVVKRSVVETIGRWNETLVRGEDSEFFIRCTQAGKFAYIDRPLVKVGRHDSNLSGDMLLQDEESLQGFALHLSNPLFSSQDKELIKRQLGRRHSGVGYNFLRIGNYHKARLHYLRAMMNRYTFVHAAIRYPLTFPVVNRVFRLLK